MKNDIIKFSTNWNNKLDNKAFTTLRIFNTNKYQINKRFDIELTNTIKGTATIKAIRTLSYHQLNDFICYLDTGYNTQETMDILQKMYKNMDLRSVKFVLCLLVYDKQPKPNSEPQKQKNKSLTQILLF